jgi:hypothetical protein
VRARRPPLCHSGAAAGPMLRSANQLVNLIFLPKI